MRANRPLVVKLSTLQAGERWQTRAAVQGENRMSDSQRFLCITSYEKGQDFIRQLAGLGVKPTLLTMDKLRDAPWPFDILEELVTMPASTPSRLSTPSTGWPVAAASIG